MANTENSKNKPLIEHNKKGIDDLKLFIKKKKIQNTALNKIIENLSKQVIKRYRNNSYNKKSITN